MEIIWRSRRGNMRNRNNDAAALWLTSEGMAACIVDGAQKSGSGGGLERKNLACYWAESLVDEIRLLGAGCSNREIHNMLVRLHRGLRPAYIKDIASYQLIIIDNESCLRVFHVGDCRLGFGDANGMSWITNPHRLIDELPDICGLSQFDIDDATSCLVRSLNARRFIAPDVVNINFDCERPLLLGTDGYWYEVFSRQVAQHDADDDSSCLILTPSLGEFDHWTVRNLSDSPNLYLNYRSTP